MKRFIEGQDRSQVTLLPECLDDYLGEDNPVRVVDAFIALIPQIESARRFKVEMRRWPRLEAVDKTCSEIDALRRAAPAGQPDSA